MNKKELDSLPCLPTAWTIALGKKGGSLLISLFLSCRLTIPAPSIPPSFLLSFFFLNSVSFHSEDSVFVLQRGGGGLPRRIKSGLQSRDECSHLTSLAPFSVSLSTPNLVTVAGKVRSCTICSWLARRKPSSGLYYIILKHFNLFLFLFIHLYLFGNSLNSRMLLAAQCGMISCIPAFS